MAALWLALATFSCASKPVRSYRRYSRAWEKNDGETVYRTLSSSWQKGSTPSTWTKASREAGRKSVRLPSGVIELQWSATMPVVFGSHRWKYTREGWRLAASPFPRYQQDTPDRAVSSFVRALEFQRFDVLARLLPDELRLAVSPEELKKMFDIKRPQIAELVEGLKKAEGTPVLVSGTTAVFPYEGNRRLRLVKLEHGWCIAEPE